jgi:hypothetical protein
VGDPLNEQGEIMPALRQVVEAAGPYLDGLPKRLVYDRAAEPMLEELGGPLPERGSGTEAAVEKLLRIGTATATACSAPGCTSTPPSACSPPSLPARPT